MHFSGRNPSRVQVRWMWKGWWLVQTLESHPGGCINLQTLAGLYLLYPPLLPLPLKVRELPPHSHPCASSSLQDCLMDSFLLFSYPCENDLELCILTPHLSAGISGARYLVYLVCAVLQMGLRA